MCATRTHSTRRDCANTSDKQRSNSSSESDFKSSLSFICFLYHGLFRRSHFVCRKRRDVNPLSKSRRWRQGEYRSTDARTDPLQSAPTLFPKAPPRSCQANNSFCSIFFGRSHQLCPDTVGHLEWDLVCFVASDGRMPVATQHHCAKFVLLWSSTPTRTSSLRPSCTRS